MAIIIPATSVTTNSGDALNITASGDVVIVNPGIQLVADGNGNDAIQVGAALANSTILVDGTLAADEGVGINLVTSTQNEITISATGRVVSGYLGINGTGTGNLVTNDGVVIADFGAVYLTTTSNTADNMVVNNGSMSSEGTTVHFGGAAQLTNTGSILSHTDGVRFANGDGVNSTGYLSNTGSITADNDAVEVTGANFSGSNSGVLQGGISGLYLASAANNWEFASTGQITGGTYGVRAAGSDGVLTNTGTITGSTGGAQLNGGNAALVNGGQIVGQTGTGVEGIDHLAVTNSGSISGTTYGIFAEDDPNPTAIGDQRVINTATGTISGGSNAGIYLQGDGGMIDNAGHVQSADSYGMIIEGTDGNIANSGNIQSRDAGIWVNGYIGTVTNSGTINTQDEGVYFNNGGLLDNTGTITAQGLGVYVGAVLPSALAEISNTGTISSLTTHGLSIHSEFILASNSGQITAAQSGIFSGSTSGGVQNSGSIAALLDGVSHGVAGGSFRIDNSGIISAGAHAIRIVSGDQVVNSGALNGATGIMVDAGSATASTRILNDTGGTIDGSTYGIRLTDANVAGVITNHGTIRSGVAIEFANGAAVTSRLTNTGQIEGTVTGTLGVQIITNAGQMLGNVALGEGDDFYRGDGGQVIGIVQGEGGADVLRGGALADHFDGGAGEDTLMGQSGDDTLAGGNDNDLLLGGAGSDDMDGGFGHDRLEGGLGDDTMNGWVGNDTMMGGDGDDHLDGSGGNDKIYGNRGNDLLSGGANVFNDSLFGGEGDDTLLGGQGDDLLEGQAGHDSLDGGTGNDVLSGGWGEDSMTGGAGLDTLTGAQGDDVMTGGTSADTFVFGLVTDNDTITDFTNGLDLLDVSALGLAGFGDVVASAVGGSTLIDLSAMGGEGTILLDGFAIANLNAADFVF